MPRLFALILGIACSLAALAVALGMIVLNGNGKSQAQTRPNVTATARPTSTALPTATPTSTPKPQPKTKRHRHFHHPPHRTVHHHHNTVPHHAVPPLKFSGQARWTGDMYGLGSYAIQRYPNLMRPALYRARLTGADWLREEFTADRLHNSPYAPYHWRRYDLIVRHERRMGFHILGLLDYSNTWQGYAARNHGYMPHWLMPRLSREFAAYAYAIARHYRGQIDTWQIWNEPDLDIFWRPYPNATDYAHLLRRAYYAVKRANPHATVVLGGPSGADPNGLGFIHRVVASGGRFDVLSVQPYRDVPDLQLLSEVQSLRQYHRPIWFTEMGWAGETYCMSVCGPEISQADRLARLYVVAAYAGVKRIFWYDLRDDSTAANFESHFGLLQWNLAAKPAYVAYHVSQYYLNRAWYLGVDRLEPQVFAFQFKKKGSKFVVLWNNTLGPFGLAHPLARQLRSCSRLGWRAGDSESKRRRERHRAAAIDPVHRTLNDDSTPVSSGRN